MQGIPPEERVEYIYKEDEKKLYRYKYKNLNQTGNDQTETSVLLDSVDQFQIMLLNPNEMAQWPEVALSENDVTQTKILPRGLKINLTVNEVSYEWVFSLLNTDFLKQKN